MKKRKFRSAAEAATSRELKASWEVLVTKHSASPVEPAPKAPPKLPEFASHLRRLRAEGRIPKARQVDLSLLSPGLDLDVQSRYAYDDPAMAKREELAQQEIHAKRSRVAPVYNKGGAQFLTDDMIEEMKTGALRRRP